MAKARKNPDYPRAELCKKKPHLWKPSSYSPDTTYEVCSRCGERRERKATKEEVKKFKAWSKALARPMKIHQTAHAYEKGLKGKQGYEAMKAAEKFASKHPDQVFITGVDDSHFASSSLVLVTHEDPEGEPNYDGVVEPNWMGVTVHLISQCSGESAAFFLYPGHLVSLIETLQILRRKMMKYPNIRRECVATHRWEAKRAKARKS